MSKNHQKIKRDFEKGKKNRSFHISNNKTENLRYKQYAESCSKILQSQ